MSLLYCSIFSDLTFSIRQSITVLQPYQLCSFPLISCSMLTHTRAPFLPSRHRCQLKALSSVFPTPMCPFYSTPAVHRKHLRTVVKEPLNILRGQTNKQTNSEKRAGKEINLIHSRSEELILPLNSSLAQDQQAAPCAFAGEERRADSAVRAKYCISKRRSPPACPRGWCMGSRSSMAAALPFPALRKSSERGTAC